MIPLAKRLTWAAEQYQLAADEYELYIYEKLMTRVYLYEGDVREVDLRGGEPDKLRVYLN